MTSEKIDFIEWLDEMRASRNWSDNQLAKTARISHSVISKARQGTLPKWDALVQIAEAFGVSPVLAFRKAGLLPPEQEDQAKFEDWKYLLEGLSDRDLSLLRDLAKKMAAENEKERALKSLNPRRVGNG
jgi:transcriptional regulator with XRE-family HTH domain